MGPETTNLLANADCFWTHAGPRQSHAGVVRNALESTFTTPSIKFKTSRTVLQNLFPPGNKKYGFKSPGTVAYCSFSQTTLDKMEWLGGSGYNHLGLYIHGIEYVKSNGEALSGTYMPILFESLTDPIVSGREELGMPKLYSSIDVYRGAESYRINTGKARCGAISDSRARNRSVTQVPRRARSEVRTTMASSYTDTCPRGTRNKGKAADEYPVFVPYKEDMPQPQTQRVWQASRATFKIDALDWHALPTLYHTGDPDV